MIPYVFTVQGEDNCTALFCRVELHLHLHFAVCAPVWLLELETGLNS